MPGRTGAGQGAGNTGNAGESRTGRGEEQADRSKAAGETTKNTTQTTTPHTRSPPADKPQTTNAHKGRNYQRIRRLSFLLFGGKELLTAAPKYAEVKK